MAWAVSLDCSTATLSLVDASGIKIERDQFQPTVGPDKTETGVTTDAYHCFINCSSVANLKAKIQELNQYFTIARSVQQRPTIAYPVYIKVMEDGSSDVWSSEVLDGDFVPDKVYNPNWTSGEVWGTLYITRQNWWSGQVATIPLTNENGTDVTAGINVYFCGDSTTAAGGEKNNYVTIDTTNDVIGDLPGYGKLTITNIPADLTYLSLTSGFTHYNFDLGTASDSDTVDAGSWGGYYLSTAISSGSATISKTNTGTSVYLHTEMSRLFARIGFSAGAGTYRIVPFSNGLSGGIRNGNPVYVTATDANMQLYDLGTMLVGDPADYGKPTVGFTAYAASGNVNCDFITVANVTSCRDYTLTYLSGATLTDASWWNTVFQRNTITEVLSPITVAGSNRILIFPGNIFQLAGLSTGVQTLTFTGRPWTASSYITVVLEYQPRRSSL